MRMMQTGVRTGNGSGERERDINILELATGKKHIEPHDSNESGKTTSNRLKTAPE
ncbi:hypothetical protein GF325_16895 [Candidatus Bathyarchaeota archaeon]|nr:hypothetical protein [Candidatus Bathyarchaeota archaeon]